MRKRLMWLVVAGAAATLALGAVAVAKPIKVTAGNLVLTFDSSVAPRKLPKRKYAPITFKISSRIATKDGSHPPVAKVFEGEVDKSGAIDPRGLPKCKQGQLEARPTNAALRACRAALIGKGTATAEVEFPEQAPFDATGPLLVFNGGGTPKKALILIHVYANVPVPTAFITRVNVSRTGKGRYGIKFHARIPSVANDAGSLKHFAINNRRIFRHKGKRKSYFLARCPTGRLWGLGNVSFDNGTRLKGTVSVPCTPKG